MEIIIFIVVCIGIAVFIDGRRGKLNEQIKQQEAEIKNGSK